MSWDNNQQAPRWTNCKATHMIRQSTSIKTWLSTFASAIIEGINLLFKQDLLNGLTDRSSFALKVYQPPSPAIYNFTAKLPPPPSAESVLLCKQSNTLQPLSSSVSLGGVAIRVCFCSPTVQRQSPSVADQPFIQLPFIHALSHSPGSSLKLPIDHGLPFLDDDLLNKT